LASGSALPFYAMLPFCLMLLAIAVFPLWLPHWWESNRNKLLVACALGLPILGLYLRRRPGALVAMGEEYVSFIILLAGLYVISGGVLLRGDLIATPLTNVGFLAVGSVLASFVGTTGASMLLIRPLLQTNQERTRVKHTVVFFIFTVSNIGGMLTPLSDPPLFLGYLQGVPFAWTFRLWPYWLLMVATLLAVYFVWDSTQYPREPIAAIVRDRTRREPLRVLGGLNALWMIGVVLAVAFLRAPARPSRPARPREVRGRHSALGDASTTAEVLVRAARASRQPRRPVVGRGPGGDTYGWTSRGPMSVRMPL
jgi:Na+/H+ antiporter NhaD/arsenite permease-like protein